MYFIKTENYFKSFVYGGLFFREKYQYITQETLKKSLIGLKLDFVIRLDVGRSVSVMFILKILGNYLELKSIYR